MCEFSDHPANVRSSAQSEDDVTCCCITPVCNEYYEIQTREAFSQTVDCVVLCGVEAQEAVRAFAIAMPAARASEVMQPPACSDGQCGSAARFPSAPGASQRGDDRRSLQDWLLQDGVCSSCSVSDVARDVLEGHISSLAEGHSQIPLVHEDTKAADMVEAEGSVANTEQAIDRLKQLRDHLQGHTKKALKSWCGEGGLTQHGSKTKLAMRVWKHLVQNEWPDLPDLLHRSLMSG